MRYHWTWLLAVCVAVSGWSPALAARDGREGGEARSSRAESRQSRSEPRASVSRDARASRGSEVRESRGSDARDTRGAEAKPSSSDDRFESGNRWDTPERSILRGEARPDVRRTVDDERNQRVERNIPIERSRQGNGNERPEPGDDLANRQSNLERIIRGQRDEPSSRDRGSERDRDRSVERSRDRQDQPSADRDRTERPGDSGNWGSSSGNDRDRVRVIDFSQRNLSVGEDRPARSEDARRFEPGLSRDERQAQVADRSAQRQREFDDARHGRQQRQQDEVNAAAAMRLERQREVTNRQLQRQSFSGSVAGRSVVTPETSNVIRRSGGYAGTWRHDDGRDDRHDYRSGYHGGYNHARSYHAPWRPAYVHRPYYPYPCSDGWRYGYRYWYYDYYDRWGCGPVWYGRWGYPYPYYGDSFYFSYRSGWYDPWCYPRSGVSIGVHIGF